MASTTEEVTVTYEELADLETELEQVSIEIGRQQARLSKPIYEKRQILVSKIPNFWALVLEQAPPDIDEYIQPLDQAVLLASLTSLSVKHLELEDGQNGDPRSVAIRWEFSENEYFEDKVLEKKFWFRYKNGEGGLVSEPIDIKWKEGKDLTGGLLGLVKKSWDRDQATRGASNGSASKGEKKELTEEQQALKAKIDETGLNALSFFAWFGYIGNWVSAEESAEELKKLMEAQKLRKEGKAPAPDAEEDEQEDEDDDEDEESLEIFPDGDDLATAIVEELWPDAIKYFTEAQQQDAMSDLDFESDDEEDDAEVLPDGSPEQPPSKKRKA